MCTAAGDARADWFLPNFEEDDMTSSLLPEAANPAYDLGGSPSEEQMAAVAFLARYSGRTLEAYRHDLRYFFQWAADHGVEVLAATRAHIEMYRARWSSAGSRHRRSIGACRRCAATSGSPTSTVASPPTPPSTYAARRSSRAEGHGMDRGELGRFLFTAEHYDRDHAALAVLLGLNGLRVSEACATNIEDLGFERGHRTLAHHRQRQQASDDPTRATHGPYDRSCGR